MRKVLMTVLAAAGLAAATTTGVLANEGAHLEKQAWNWQGLFGTYDREAQQRGWQVYHDVCGNCHPMNQLYYRNLAQLGFNEEQVKAFAAEAEVVDGPNDEGQMFTRPGRPSDHLKAPFPNEKAARAANNGALPPDLSLIIKARAGGPDYAYNLLLGYEENPPADVQLQPGMYYNKIFAGHQIGMPPPLQEDIVTFPHGPKATKEQLARDVVSYLQWAAEPELEVRKQLGLKTLIFLAVLTALFYALKRKIWADVH